MEEGRIVRPEVQPLVFSPEQKEQWESLTPGELTHLREKAQTNCYFLGKVVLGYDQISERAHLALCAFMDREKKSRRMVLMPRGHLKTTICTITDSIKLVLANPNVRILIQNEVLDNAADMLKELKQHFMKGEMLRALFPELIPERYFGPGSDWGMESSSINRTTKAKESTWTASGSGGSPQSKHFEHVKNDDLIGKKHRESELEMQKAIAWTDGMQPLLDRLGDQLDYYGTRKTMSDIYAHVMEQEGDRLAVFCREPIEDGQPIFPEKFTLDELNHIMVSSPEMWAYDYMNNPIGKGGLDWGKGLLREYELKHDRVIYAHHLTGELQEWNLRELDVVITADPNSGKTLGTDKAAVIVHGVSPDDQIFILDTWSARVQPDDFIDAIWDRARKWSPRVIGIEDAGQQNALYYFEKRCMLEGLYFRIMPLLHRNMDKERRIRFGLDIPLKARRFYVQPWMTTLIGQIQLFPQLPAHNWDEIDATAYGPQLYQTGTSDADIEEAEEADGKVLALRGLTGYGVSV